MGLFQSPNSSEIYLVVSDLALVWKRQSKEGRRTIRQSFKAASLFFPLKFALNEIKKKGRASSSNLLIFMVKSYCGYESQHIEDPFKLYFAICIECVLLWVAKVFTVSYMRLIFFLQLEWSARAP